MTEADDIDDLKINAFVDGQLDAANFEAVLAAMETDPETRHRVYLARRAKDLMRVGFGNAGTLSPARRGTKKSWSGGRRGYGLAASLAMLIFGFGSGVLGYYVSSQLAQAENNVALASLQGANAHHVILHISESDPRQFSAAMRYVEAFLNHNPAAGSQIGVVANAGGLDLMRDGVSPFTSEITAIMRHHDNVHFIACSAGLQNLRRRGIQPKFIGDIDTDKTAIDHIVNRLKAGWTYIKVDDLPQV